MTKIIFCVIIFQGIFLLVKSDESQCYKYTWIAPAFDNSPDRYNCSKYKGVPCMEPVLTTADPPNTTKFWEDKINLCTVKSGNVCVKYTYIYNNDIVNTSSFCGKVIEDDTLPVTSGCYQQNVGGYILEMCACGAREGREPCNASVQIKYSTILAIATLLAFVNFA